MTCFKNRLLLNLCGLIPMFYCCNNIVPVAILVVALLTTPVVKIEGVIATIIDD